VDNPGTPMLERIHIENYKCLRDVTVGLGDFTILIGLNDSGKTSFLEAVQTFGKILEQGYPAIFTDDHSLANLVWGKDSGLQIVLEAAGTTPGHRFVYRLEFRVGERPPCERLECDGRTGFSTKEVLPDEAQPEPNFPPGTLTIVLHQGQASEPSRQPVQRGKTGLQFLVEQRASPFLGIADALKSSVEYRFDVDKLPKPAIPKPGIKLDPSGDNLAAVLDVMQNSPDRSAFEALQNALHREISTLRGIVLPPARPPYNPSYSVGGPAPRGIVIPTVPQPSGAKALEFILSRSGQSPVTIPGSLASGGALLLTAYLTLAYTETAGLLLIEEPENGLHPSRLQMVLDLLRRMSRGEIGNRKRQIILTTHNPLLLNYASPEEVRVFVRHPEQGTRVIPMTEVPDINRLMEEFALGELWYLLGEEKLFQEQPA